MLHADESCIMSHFETMLKLHSRDKWIETIPIHLAAALIDYPGEAMPVHKIESIFRASFHYKHGIQIIQFAKYNYTFK